MSDQELDEINIDPVDCRVPLITTIVSLIVLFCYVLFSSITAINELEKENTNLKNELFEQRVKDDRNNKDIYGIEKG